MTNAIFTHHVYFLILSSQEPGEAATHLPSIEGNFRLPTARGSLVVQPSQDCISGPWFLVRAFLHSTRAVMLTPADVLWKRLYEM